MNDRDEHLPAFCATLPRLRAAVARHGLADELARVVAEVRAGAPVAELLPRLGIPADVLRSGEPTGVPSLPVYGRPVHEVHVCPWDGCARAVARQPGGPIPDERCWITDRPLRRDRR